MNLSLKSTLPMFLPLIIGTSSGYADIKLTHNAEICDQNVVIQSTLNDQHLKIVDGTLSLTTQQNSRAVFNIGCEFESTQFTLFHSSGYLWAKTENDLSTGRGHPGNSGKFHFVADNQGRVSFVSAKWHGRHVSVDSNERFSLVDVSSTAPLANELFRLHSVSGDPQPDPDPHPTEEISHIGTTQIWDKNGQNIRVERPSGSQEGDLLILVLHRTDDVLPLRVDGWTYAASCYKRDNGYNCVTADDCERWDGNFCSYFGSYGRKGEDLAQSIFYKTVASNEPGSYTFNLNKDSSGHPGWVILTALRGANTNDPIRDTNQIGCDKDVNSRFPSVYGVKGDMVLLSQSFDDRIAKSRFQAPVGTATLGYVSNSDEAGFLYGGILTQTGETGVMETRGEGGPGCKDGLVSLTVKPDQ